MMARRRGRGMADFFAELRERGFVSQSTHEDPRAVLGDGRITAYVGFDPTAESLQAGNLVPIMALVHLQRAGGKPIVVVGGATGLIGDPSGKLEARPMLTEETIQRHLEAQKAQFGRFLDFGDGASGAVLVNNADWFRGKEYIAFLREIGTHFSINRMIKLESVVNRLEKGLSYLEFNYMILQAYDFLVLHDRYGCRLQMGGDDQWGNIVMGMELIRRMRRRDTCGITFPLITSAGGRKMGKTEKGTLWLDAARTSPYEFYQYWINVEDGLVARCLNFYTLLGRKEREDLARLEDSGIREAKRVLAVDERRRLGLPNLVIVWQQILELVRTIWPRHRLLQRHRFALAKEADFHVGNTELERRSVGVQIAHAVVVAVDVYEPRKATQSRRGSRFVENADHNFRRRIIIQLRRIGERHGTCQVDGKTAFANRRCLKR